MKRLIATVVSLLVMILLGIVDSPPKTAAVEMSPVSDTLSGNIVKTGDRIDRLVAMDFIRSGWTLVSVALRAGPAFADILVLDKFWARSSGELPLALS